jgi:hypothetical protein
MIKKTADNRRKGPRDCKEAVGFIVREKSEPSSGRQSFAKGDGAHPNDFGSRCTSNDVLRLAVLGDQIEPKDKSVKFSPETFFIGIIDFFSIILPGAVLIYFTSALLQKVFFGSASPNYKSEAEKSAIFLFSSYLLGHFIFAIASNLDKIYDRIRLSTSQANTGTSTRSGSRLEKWIAAKCVPTSADALVERIVSLRHKHIPDADDVPIINAFQWCKARLTIQCPAALAEVQRFEADSKFFRSLVIVFLILIAWSVVIRNFPLTIASVILGTLSFSRYFGRRLKSTEQAYRHILTFEGIVNPVTKGVEPPVSPGVAALP